MAPAKPDGMPEVLEWWRPCRGATKGSLVLPRFAPARLAWRQPLWTWD